MNQASLYEQAMGQSFALLPRSVQTFHTLRGRHYLAGEVETTAPQGFIAKLLARSLGSPLKSQKGPLHFELNAHPNLEKWVRGFPENTMTSRLTLVDGQIVERLGLARLGFKLHAHADKLEMKLLWMRFLGIPCPRWLLPEIVGEESGSDGRFHFLAQASVPWVGLVARYEGYLSLQEAAAK